MIRLRSISFVVLVLSLKLSKCSWIHVSRLQKGLDVKSSNSTIPLYDDGGIDEADEDQAEILHDSSFDLTKIIPGTNTPLVWSAKTKSSNSDKNRRRQHIQYLLKGKQVYDYFLLERDGSSVDAIKPGSNLKILIHGFTQHDEPWEEKILRSKMFDLADEYIASSIPNLEVVVVNWTELSTYPSYKYNEAADSTQYVGVDVAEFIIQLARYRVITLDKVHIIGYSLGAHVAGVAGYTVRKRTGRMVGRITGIDPAGPLFVENDDLISDKRMVLERSDAQFVDIIHCNMGDMLDGKWGSKIQAGHADFYPNGGQIQRGCDKFNDATNGCSHILCPSYFVQSVNKKRFPSCKCFSWAVYNKEKYRCDCQDYEVEMGERLNTSIASGRYYLLI